MGGDGFRRTGACLPPEAGAAAWYSGAPPTEPSESPAFRPRPWALGTALCGAHTAPARRCLALQAPTSPARSRPGRRRGEPGLNLIKQPHQGPWGARVRWQRRGANKQRPPAIGAGPPYGKPAARVFMSGLGGGGAVRLVFGGSASALGRRPPLGTTRPVPGRHQPCTSAARLRR